jgi:dsRNA-specific ribonuclease
MNTKLQQYIRPRAILQGSQSRNWIRLIVNDFKVLGCDPGRTIANGIKAIIGAVYFDGGFESARRVMAQFGLIIKVPKPAPVPMPPGQIVKYA